ncbi:type II toxin-antitoxin system RelE family toxin [Deinococcus arenicola]|uniref:Type II toxin-antitoxin system RelE/ParE family toxin n=1 Tax=Deinococcus arenicola TaxID=2994950 RepID=A0ABU4DPX9_9DEIO|nr:type II toxin-antitoxin system RelE/ParE family toxin [Deinococcus sp. ZS9-10]MDV6374481.1 type II toxin-antitoxin system RelE/ParE family toxin [Deinococcus sp. ZS9-10]
MTPFGERGAPYPFSLTRTAQKALRSIPERDLERILKAIEAACKSGLGDVLALKSHEADYRLRVGEYRVIFDVQEMDDGAATVVPTVVILTVLRRTGKTYR